MKTDNDHHVFNQYAQVYDDLYRDKNYIEECDVLERILNRFGTGKMHHILDMGCGTGSHALLLAQKGYEVFGIDRSPEMISIAKMKRSALELSKSVFFEVADLHSAQIDRTFDAAICMFAVLSYQTSNEDVYATLLTARKHIRPGGLFIADFWYGPAVLSVRPEERVKILEKDGERTIRIAKPTMDTENNTVNVKYHILRLQQHKLVDEMHEDHLMRYFFMPEINFYMQQAGFNLLHTCPFAELENQLKEDNWNAMIIAQAV